MAPATLLSHVRAQLTVDVDSMDPLVAARHTTDQHRFSDMTSNQAIVYSEAVRPERAPVVQAAVAHVRASERELDLETKVSDALDLLTVLLAKEVYPYLTGRVHAQASPSAAYDTEATIRHAKKLVALFEAHGIPKSRVCIKIPTTPESVVACNYLERLGIRTLATCLFSVPQAMAAHQAGCLYVAPYFNELRVHFEPGVWKEYQDTAREHPMAPVIGAIVQLFKELGSSTLVMPASIVTAKEVVALVSLKPDHLTLSGAVLDQLAAAESPAAAPDDPQPHHPEVPVSSEPAGAAPTGETKGPNVKAINYLENEGAALREAFAADAEASRKMADALRIFGEMEEKTRVLLRAMLQA
ncbi:aldolase [Trametes cingulata]|nr:aldolase [Trametes cingulata]